MIKRIVCLGAIMIMAFSLFACGNTFDFQKQINDLKDRIELQDGKIEELKEENKALEEKNTALEKEVAELNKDEWRLLESYDCCEVFDEWPDDYNANNAKSEPLFQEARRHFILNYDEYPLAEIKYTDDYAGDYVGNDGINVICITGNRRPLESDYLVYKLVDNSYNYLRNITKEVAKIMLEYSVFGMSVCPTCNRAAIRLEKGNEIHLIVEHLKLKGLYKKGTLNFYVGENDASFI